jgi:hypothetical protein
VIVGHGPKGSRPAGRLPVFTVNNAREAQFLLTLACPTNDRGEFYAPELAEEQTLQHLDDFAARLEQLYHKHVAKP